MLERLRHALTSRAHRYKVMQIETSNRCSLACIYCPHPGQARPKGDMTFDTFRKCMTVVRRSANPVHDGRKFVWLNHFGEPLLNPLLPEFIAHARERDIEVSFSSNAVDDNHELFPRSTWQELARAGLKRVCLSAHAKSPRVLEDHIGDIVKIMDIWKPTGNVLHDWAGQVDMSRFDLAPAGEPQGPCDYQTHDMFAVTWEGRIAACCYDLEGSSLSIDDVLRRGFRFREIALCRGCKLGRGDVDQLHANLD